MSAQQFKSRNSYKLVLFFLVLGIFFCAGFGVFLFRFGMEGRYPKLWPLVGSAGMAIGVVLCLRAILKLDTLFIYPDRLEVQSILGSVKQVIYLNDITSFIETHQKEKGSDYYQLTIYTRNASYCVRSRYYANYNELKQALTTGKFRDTDKEREMEHRSRLAVAAFLAVAGCVFVGIWWHGRSEAPVNADRLRQVTGVISNTVEVSKGSKGARWVNIRLSQYPYFTFKLQDAAYHALKIDDYIRFVNTGDTLTLGIDKDEYEMKLTNEKEPTFWVKSVNYEHIDVYELKDKNRSYLTVNDYNEKNRNNSRWISAIFGCVFLVMSAFVFKRAGTGVPTVYS